MGGKLLTIGQMTLYDVRCMQQLLNGENHAEILSLRCRSEGGQDEDDSIIADIREAIAVAKKKSERVILADLGHTPDGPKLLLRVLLQRCRERFVATKPHSLALLECIVDLQQSIEVNDFWDCFVLKPECTSFLLDALTHASGMVRRATELVGGEW